MTVIETIRLVGREFRTVSDSELEGYIELYSPLVSRKMFGKLYGLALAYIICHKLKVAGYGDNPFGELGKVGIGLTVGSVSEGGSSISFGANQSSSLAKDAEYATTEYGLQYLSIRRKVIVPIHVRGENGTQGTADIEQREIIPPGYDLATEEDIDEILKKEYGYLPEGYEFADESDIDEVMDKDSGELPEGYSLADTSDIDDII